MKRVLDNPQELGQPLIPLPRSTPLGNSISREPTTKQTNRAGGRAGTNNAGGGGGGGGGCGDGGDEASRSSGGF